MSKKTAPSNKKVNLPFREDHLPLAKQNYMLILLGFAIILVGFLLMIGDENIYDFRKTVLSPIIVMFGFVFLIYAIMKRPKSESANTGTDVQA